MTHALVKLGRQHRLQDGQTHLQIVLFADIRKLAVARQLLAGAHAAEGVARRIQLDLHGSVHQAAASSVLLSYVSISTPSGLQKHSHHSTTIYISDLAC